MKLLKTESPYLDKDQWRKVLLALSIMTIALYVVAMVFSLCGSKYFILNYQNAQMDRIEQFLYKTRLTHAVAWGFSTIECFLVSLFILQKRPKWYFILSFYAIPFALIYIFNGLPDIVQNIIPIIFYLLLPLFTQLIDTKTVKFKRYLWCIVRLLVAIAITMFLQTIIYVIKTGDFLFHYVNMNLSGLFIYSLEYDIALLVIFATISLFINREKGDSKQWTEHTDLGGSSQTSKKQSQKSLLKKNLTKTQRTKLRWLYARFYLVQILGFLLLMVLPFLLGKVFEFLMMYLAFAVVRYILGFKYSLHYKKEALCIAVGVAVFGILSLAIPFFYVVVIIALVMGSGLAVLLHLSYKYKGMWLFNKVSKPDKFAVLYVFFDGDLSEHHVKKMCRYKGLSNEQVQLIWDYVQGNKISYLAWKFNYSQRMLIYKLDEAIEKLTA